MIETMRMFFIKLKSPFIFIASIYAKVYFTFVWKKPLFLDRGSVYMPFLDHVMVLKAKCTCGACGTECSYHNVKLYDCDYAEMDLIDYVNYYETKIKDIKKRIKK